MSKNITQSYVVTELEISIISQKASVMGDSSVSAALRAIIREWKELTDPAIVAAVSVETPDTPAA